jgi:hypothetical protein
MNTSRIGELLAVLIAASSFETKETTTVIHNKGDYNVGYVIDAVVKKIKAEIESPETVDDEIRDVVSELKNALSPIKEMAKSVAAMKSSFDGFAAAVKIISESAKPPVAVSPDKQPDSKNGADDDLPY